jgi:hypothetical protein
MNLYAVAAIFRQEIARTRRTWLQSVVSPVISTSLYFIVFGAAIGSRISTIEGASYGAFIVPGLMMLTLLTQSVSNAAIGIYFPRFTGTIYEILSAPVSTMEILLGYVGAAAVKSIVLGLVILGTSALFVPIHIVHPLWMLTLLPARISPRRLGRRRRQTAGRAAVDHHAADVFGRYILFDQRAAAVLAHGDAVQSDLLSDFRLPLELLRSRRRACRHQRDGDLVLSRRLLNDRVVGLQDRLPAQNLSRLHHSSRNGSGNLNRWLSFGRGWKTFTLPEPAHLALTA